MKKLDQKIVAIRIVDGIGGRPPSMEEVETTYRDVIKNPNRFRIEDVLNSLCVFASGIIEEDEFKEKTLVKTIKDIGQIESAEKKSAS